MKVFLKIASLAVLLAGTAQAVQAKPDCFKPAAKPAVARSAPKRVAAPRVCTTCGTRPIRRMARAAVYAPPPAPPVPAYRDPPQGRTFHAVALDFGQSPNWGDSGITTGGPSRNINITSYSSLVNQTNVYGSVRGQPVTPTPAPPFGGATQPPTNRDDFGGETRPADISNIGGGNLAPPVRVNRDDNPPPLAFPRGEGRGGGQLAELFRNGDQSSVNNGGVSQGIFNGLTGAPGTFGADGIFIAGGGNSSVVNNTGTTFFQNGGGGQLAEPFLSGNQNSGNGNNNFGGFTGPN